MSNNLVAIGFDTTFQFHVCLAVILWANHLTVVTVLVLRQSVYC